VRRGANFWYVAFTDSRVGYLLDLVERPAGTMARLAIFRRGAPARVLRQLFPVGTLEVSHDGVGVALGPWRLDGERCEGALEGVTLRARTAAAGPEVTLVPGWIAALFSRVPAFRSAPITLVEGTAGESSFRDLPGVRSRYHIGDLARARWFLISVQSFNGQDAGPDAGRHAGHDPGTSGDARCEISAAWLFNSWAASGYLRLGGQTIPINQPLRNLLRFRVGAAGQRAGGRRQFQVSYASPRLGFELEASAAEEAFVALEREGSTMIHTTLFGDCRLTVTRGGSRQTLAATGTCLLEVKEVDPPAGPRPTAGAN
jgi:hypothetical protein